LLQLELDIRNRNHGVKAMVAERRPRLATNIIFTTALVSLLTVNYWFSRLR